MNLLFSLLSIVALSSPANQNFQYSSEMIVEAQTISHVYEHADYYINTTYDFHLYINYSSVSQAELVVKNVDIRTDILDDSGYIDYTYNDTYNFSDNIILGQYSDIAILFNIDDFDFKYTFSFVNDYVYTLDVSDYFSQQPILSFGTTWTTNAYVLANYVQMYLDSKSGDYNFGYSRGYEDGYEEGTERGGSWQDGYNQGYQDGASQDETALTIFEGIVTIALVPINFFLAIFNFEIFGINLSGFVSALLTISIIIIVIRFITGKKQGSDD